MTDFTLSLWVPDYAYPVASLDDWLALVAAKAKEARNEGAQMLVMPEYVCVHWLSFASNLPDHTSIGWMAGLRDSALSGLQAIAADTGMAIMTGTFPVEVPQPYPPVLYKQPNDIRAHGETPRFYNRAYVIGRDGTIIHTQDKMVMTPWEMDETNCNMHGGAALDTFELDGVRFGILVCLDVQQSVLARALYAKGTDILLVPSMTLHPSGYNRVLTCARARAIEGLIGVAVTGGVGVPPYLVGKETNYSGAGIYTPCEMDIVPDGVLAQLQPSYGMARTSDGALCTATVPVDAIRMKRQGCAEAWPGVIG